jgi:shikimate 5-dehydrogenase
MTSSTRFNFVGVTTGQSAIMRIFPEWAKYLGLSRVSMAGIDLPIHAGAELYRLTVQRLTDNPADLGALVTTHKLDLFEACQDMFDYLDEYARLCGEVSCISKRDGSLEGHAKDPISAGKSLEHIIEGGHWTRTRANALCLGAGGAAIAITLCLMTSLDSTDRPARIVVVNRSESRLKQMARIHEQLDSQVPVDYILNEDPVANDQIVAAQPPGSLVINATGRGKDTPGSPISDRAVFPERGLVWELNYRGELDFLHQAERQAAERQLSVHDGWLYFIYGWSAVLEQVFHVELTPQQLNAMSRIALLNR